MKTTTIEFCTNPVGLEGFSLMIRLLENKWHRSRYGYSIEKNIPCTGTTLTKHRIVFWKRKDWDHEQSRNGRS